MYSRILLPTDGSDGAAAATDAAIELARRFDATVDALHVVDERLVMDEFDASVEEAEAVGERALDAVSDRASGSGVAVERHLRRGVPHREIVDAVGDYGVDLVVMGTHGRTGFDRFLNLGSVAERVVRAAPVHVVTVPVEPRPGGRASAG